MPGGVGGAASRGAPLSRFNTVQDLSACGVGLWTIAPSISASPGWHVPCSTYQPPHEATAQQRMRPLQAHRHVGSGDVLLVCDLSGWTFIEVSETHDFTVGRG